jgi:DNA-binding NtrC family response regulator
MIVMPPESRAPLQACLAECGADPFLVTSCAEASKVLDLAYSMTAIFSSMRLPDGGFGDLVRMARQRRRNVPVIVCLPEGDGGWSDLLEGGAFQVLVEPYDTPQIKSLIGGIVERRTAAVGW